MKTGSGMKSWLHSISTAPVFEELLCELLELSLLKLHSSLTAGRRLTRQYRKQYQNNT
jgi:hypothetical protein